MLVLQHLGRVIQTCVDAERVSGGRDDCVCERKTSSERYEFYLPARRQRPRVSGGVRQTGDVSFAAKPGMTWQNLLLETAGRAPRKNHWNPDQT